MSLEFELLALGAIIAVSLHLLHLYVKSKREPQVDETLLEVIKSLPPASYVSGIWGLLTVLWMTLTKRSRAARPPVDLTQRFLARGEVIAAIYAGCYRALDHFHLSHVVVVQPVNETNAASWQYRITILSQANDELLVGVFTASGFETNIEDRAYQACAFELIYRNLHKEGK